MRLMEHIAREQLARRYGHGSHRSGWGPAPARGYWMRRRPPPGPFGMRPRRNVEVRGCGCCLPIPLALATGAGIVAARGRRGRLAR
jgi:hypothetical protein